MAGYPSNHDMMFRRHAIRRRDSFYCLQAAQAHRLLGNYELARAVLKVARRYDREARAFGFALPGGER